MSLSVYRLIFNLNVELKGPLGHQRDVRLTLVLLRHHDIRLCAARLRGLWHHLAVDMWNNCYACDPLLL